MFGDPYFIAIKKNGGNVLETLDSYTPFIPPKGKYYADPMVFKEGGVNYLFFEDYDYRKGVISYVTLDQESFSEPRLALELPTHLSFPQLFREGNEIYMTLETYDERAISLFRAVRFPDQWERKRVLVEGGKFSDPILFKQGGLYWLFAAVRMDRLVIYYAESLEGEFHPHPINRKGVRGRNAGPLLQRGERLIRPTMDCRCGYGRSIILKEILLLDPIHFMEKEVGKILPNWAPHLDGTHTFSENEDYVVYDGRLEEVAE